MLFLMVGIINSCLTVVNDASGGSLSVVLHASCHRSTPTTRAQNEGKPMETLETTQEYHLVMVSINHRQGHD